MRGRQSSVPWGAFLHFDNVIEIVMAVIAVIVWWQRKNKVCRWTGFIWPASENEKEKLNSHKRSPKSSFSRHLDLKKKKGIWRYFCAHKNGNQVTENCGYQKCILVYILGDLSAYMFKLSIQITQVCFMCLKFWKHSIHRENICCFIPYNGRKAIDL